jgi:tetratricopeptide repeat protein
MAATAVGAATLVHDAEATAAAPKRAALLVAALLLGALLPADRRPLAPAAGTSSRGADPQPEPIAPAVGVWLGLVAWMALSLAWGTAAGRLELASWLMATALLLALQALPLPSRQLAAEATAAIAGGGAAAWALLQWLDGRRGLGIDGGQGNPDWLGLLMATALPATIALAGRRWRWCWLPVALELVALAGARSRTAWIATLVAFACSWRGLSLRRCLVPMAGALAIAAAAGPALVGRLWIWRAAAGAALDHAPFGCGLGGFGRAFAVAQGRMLAELPLGIAERRFVLAGTAHSDWLQLFTEGGALSPALLAAALVLAARAAWRGRWRAGAATVLTVAVAAIADVPLRQPAILALLALVVAASPASSASVAARSPRSLAASLEAGPRRPRAASRALAALGLVCATFGLACAAPCWWAEHLATHARQVAPEARLRLIDRAIALDSASPALAFEAGLARLALADPRGAIPFFERARAGSWQIAQDLALADAWLRLGEPARSAAIARETLVLAPGSVRARLGLADALLRLGRSGEAAQELALVRRRRPRGPVVQRLTAAMAGRLAPFAKIPRLQ